MLKLICCLRIVTMILLLYLTLPLTAAGAVCGLEPPLPPGGLVWPASGEVVNGWTLDCATDRGHRGIDISAGPGSAVRAAAAGTVAFVGYTPAEGGGTTVSISHPGGLRSTYLHLVEASVSRGDSVAQGQQIAFAGERPLHFGLKLDQGSDTYFNPLDFLAGPAPAAGSPTPLPEPLPVTAPAVATGSPASGAGNPAPEPVAPVVRPQSVPAVYSSGVVAASPGALTSRHAQAATSTLPTHVVSIYNLPGLNAMPLNGEDTTLLSGGTMPAAVFRADNQNSDGLRVEKPKRPQERSGNAQGLLRGFAAAGAALLLLGSAAAGCCLTAGRKLREPACSSPTGQW